MSKTRVYELAKELNVASKEIIEKAKEVGISYNSHMSTMEEAEISKIKGAWNSKPAAKSAPKAEKKEAKPAPKQEVKKAEPKKEVEKVTLLRKNLQREKTTAQNKDNTNKIKNVTILKIKDVMNKTIREIKNVQTKNHKTRMETVLHLRKNQHAMKLVQTNKDK